MKEQCRSLETVSGVHQIDKSGLELPANVAIKTVFMLVGMAFAGTVSGEEIRTP